MPDSTQHPYRTLALKGTDVVDRDFPLDRVSEHLDADPQNSVWVDLTGDIANQIHALEPELDLHELAVEDALGPHQRPKLDQYAAHEFLAIRAIGFDHQTGKLDEYEMDAFMAPRWLVSFQKDSGFDDDEINKRLAEDSPLAKNGVSYWVYVVLDVVVDNYLNVTERFDEWYDELSAAIFSGKPLPAALQERWFAMRRSLVRLHRLTFGMRETVERLIRRSTEELGEMRPYYEDVLDHLVRSLDLLDSLRALDASVMDTNISLQDYRQNQVMKKVGSWAAIIGVPTAVTGFYGTNVPYPGYNEQIGFITMMAIGVVSVIVLYIQFKRRDWL